MLPKSPWEKTFDGMLQCEWVNPGGWSLGRRVGSILEDGGYPEGCSLSKRVGFIHYSGRCGGRSRVWGLIEHDQND